jgi:hypothetical protein
LKPEEPTALALGIHDTGDRWHHFLCRIEYEPVAVSEFLTITRASDQLGQESFPSGL